MNANFAVSCLKRLIEVLAAVAVVVFGSAQASPQVADANASAYEAFRDYRQSLLQPGVDPVGYFSRSMLEGWLQMLLSDGAERSSVTRIKAIRSRKRFGRYIDVVHEYAIDRSGPYAAKLKLKISRRQSSQQREVTISYVLENGGWKIAFVAWDDTDTARMPVLNVVESFPSVPADDSGEIVPR